MLSLFGISQRDGGPRDGIHVLWTPPYPTGHSRDGFTLRRRRRRDQSTPKRECFDVDATAFETLHRYGHELLPSAEAWARSWTRIPKVPTHPVHGWTYRFDLARRYDAIEIHAEGSVAFAARARDGRVVDVQELVGGRCTLRGTDIGRIWIAAMKPLRKAQICGFVEDPDWSNSTVLVTKLQMPFAAVDRTLANVSQERARATSRLLEGETLDGDFEMYSQCMNASLARPHALPAWHVIAAQPSEAAKDFDVAALGYGLSLTLLPSWRRALGLGWFDPATMLDAGASYDYRLDGTIPQCDRDERRLDFHTVPRGYQLPIAFRIGPAMVCCDRSPVVEAIAEPSGVRFEPLHKGIRFRLMTVLFDEPVSALVLHGSGEVTYEGTPAPTGRLRLGERSELRFSAPITELRLRGDGFFAGMSLDVLPPGTDPRRPVPVSTTVLAVRFEATAAPSVPTSVTIEPLTGRSAHAGFELRWLPPDHLPELMMDLWPVDAESAPPTEVSWYEIERAEVDAPFRPTDELTISSRNVEPVEETPCFGFDLHERFPPHDRGGRMRDVHVRARDVIEREGARTPWGAEFRYRVRAVDLIGRRSAVAEVGGTLEKHRRPPPPSSPSELRDRSEEAKLAPAGVQVRVVESATASDADRPLLGTHDAVAVVRWGWGTEEREQDPDVREFRVYQHVGSFPEVLVKLRGPAAAVADGWQLRCTFDHALDEDEFAGQDVVLGTRVFRILAHGTGPETSLVVARSAAQADAVPAAATLRLVRDDPEDWDTRVQVVPIGPQVDHQVIVPLDAWLRPDAAHARIEGAIGVTACDAETYVDDRRSSEANPRKGNESTVAQARVVRRHPARVVFEPTPLADIATVSLPRCEGDEVVHLLRPAEYGMVPPGRIRVERCSSGPLLRSLVHRGATISLRRRRPDQTSERVERWALSAADTSSLSSQLEAGTVEDRFLPHIAAALGTDADRFFAAVGDLDAGDQMRDTLPNHRERHVYRVRPLDEGGRPSVAAQVLPVVFAIPLYTQPPNPEVAIEALDNGRARIRVVHEGDAQNHVLLFHAFDPSAQMPRVSFAWIRNRPDLLPDRAAILRDDRGAQLTAAPLPTVEEVTTNRTRRRFVATHEVVIPVGHRLCAWALSVSAVGVPSGLVGPQTLSHGVPLQA